MLAQGRLVDRYLVETQIGQGGMAFVYRVRHKTLGTRHALKVLQSTNPEVRERMIIEGQVQAKLRHPHVVAVTDVVEVDGHPGLLMEFVRGPALDEWLMGYKPTTAEALTVFRGIVAGVGYAHSRGLVHRDLKSANIMMQVDDNGVTPLVTDFGLAKVSRTDGRATQSGTTFGTPAFMAPEQIRDASAVDRRADLYSLGCILYELFTGRTPYVGDDLIELFTAVASGNYPDPRIFNPNVPGDVVDCIEGLLQVDVNRRTQDCASILRQLDEGETETIVFSKTLPEPRPMPEVGKASLDLGTAGADYAARFVRRVITKDLAVNAEWDSQATMSVPSNTVFWGLGIGGVAIAAFLALTTFLLLAVVGLLLANPQPVAVPVATPAVEPTTPEAVTPESIAPAPVVPPKSPEPIEPVRRKLQVTVEPEPEPVSVSQPEPEPEPEPDPVETIGMTFKSTPSWGAKVWIDGKSVGETPLMNLPVGVGSHQIKMSFTDPASNETFLLKEHLSVRKRGSKVWKWNLDNGQWTAE